MVSTVTAVIKSALSSQTLHYSKTTSSFSEDARLFSKIHSYKNTHFILKCSMLMFQQSISLLENLAIFLY